jgi:dimethylaniline monooxygenase (N-oxide forming)
VEEFKGMKVLLVGLSNTGADTAAELVGHAKKIYVSHRTGHKLVKQFFDAPVIIKADGIQLPRYHEGKPLDFLSPRRITNIKYALEKYLPWLSRWAFDFFCDQLTKKHFSLDPAWRFASPIPHNTQTSRPREDRLIAPSWRCGISTWTLSFC